MVQYSPRAFFRQVSNDLLRRYFEAKAISIDVDWAELAETAIDPLFAAWIQLDDDIREEADADFTEVGHLANQAGLDTMIQEGEWHGLDLSAAFQELDDPHDAAMFTLVEHPDVFRVSTLFQTADEISPRRWHRRKGLPEATPRDDAGVKARLASELSAYFLRNEARGGFCQIEIYQRAGDFYYFAFPEDYARAEQDVVGGQLVRQTHRPVFQLVFVYSPSRGTLDATAPGGRQTVEKLMSLALAAMVGQEGPATSKEDRVYDLEPLTDPNLTWKHPSDVGIAQVWLKSLRLSFKAGKDRIVLEGNRAGAVAALYDRLLADNGSRAVVVRESVNLTQAVIRVEFSPRGTRKLPPRDIRITWPNTCNLGQDKMDRTLREMLIDSGIDPLGIGRENLR